MESGSCIQEKWKDPPKKLVAIVVPLSFRTELTPDEQISLRHLQYYLGRYDKYFIIPKSTQFSREGFYTRRIPDKYFGSWKAHARLQLSEEFYETFSEYKYILMYHLDALVFSDQLVQWCNADWDYIGAPWLPCQDTPWVTKARVGNSGFALFKIQSILKVMGSKRYTLDPQQYWEQVVTHYSFLKRLIRLPNKYLKKIHYFNGVRSEMAKWPDRTDGTGNSDYFWSDAATNYYPQFRIPPVAEGLRFAFEVAPRLCFELNHRRLPFGCHAWARYDRGFWEPHLLTQYPS